TSRCTRCNTPSGDSSRSTTPSTRNATSAVPRRPMRWRRRSFRNSTKEPTVASIKKRADGTYRARYRDDAGKEHAKHCARLTDAQKWLDEKTASLVRGDYIDPKAGRVTFKEYADDWIKTKSVAASTMANVNGRL